VPVTAAPMSAAPDASSPGPGAGVLSSAALTSQAVKAPVIVDAKTYSAADLDVEEPVLLSPKPLLPAPTSRKETATTRTVELVIDQAGRVQSSKLVGVSTSMDDFSMLQPLPLLKFRPAVKDGRPVRYRYRLRLSSDPE
jgi:hypothetical protein